MRKKDSKRRRPIWTAPAEMPGGEPVIDLFAPEEEENSAVPDLGFSAPAWEERPAYAMTERPPEFAPPQDDADKAADTADENKNDEPIEDEPLFSERTEEDSLHARRKARGLAICALAVLLIMLLAFAWFVFRVETITVLGNEQLTKEEVIQRAGVEKGTHMLLLRTSSCEDALRMDPYIATASIVRKYPATVEITIKERTEAAVIIGMNSVAIIDPDGYVLSIGERDSYKGLVKIYGAGSSGYRVNGHVGDTEDYTSRAMVRMIAAIKKSGLLERIDSADISNTLNVTLLTSFGVTVQLGQPEDLDNKLRILSVIMPELISRGYTDGTVQITSHGDPVYSPPQSAIAPSGDETEDDEYTYIPSDTAQPEQGAETTPETAQPGAAPSPALS